jgi:hypothetical protein
MIEFGKGVPIILEGDIGTVSASDMLDVITNYYDIQFVEQEETDND